MKVSVASTSGYAKIYLDCSMMMFYSPTGHEALRDSQIMIGPKADVRGKRVMDVQYLPLIMQEC
jgi:hypothetical protein